MKVEKIYFWPKWFKDSLPPAEQSSIKPALINKLGRANLYLWRALNIYDDFLDNDGQPAKLPLANSYYRRYLEIYYRLNLKAGFYQLFDRIMVSLDSANQQEILQNRVKINCGKIDTPHELPIFTDLSWLAHKSLALGLGPIAILYSLSKTPKKSKIEVTLNFFRYALAAKQLADDSQDWFEDLQNGVITAANVSVLQAAKRRRLSLDLRRRPEVVYLLFATEATAKISHDLKKLCRRAKFYGAKINSNSDSRLITEVIGPIEVGLAEAAEFRSHWVGETSQTKFS
jgi:hypothetical protein